MKTKYQLIVVIPVGPACQLHHVGDTIESINFYVSSSFRIILADDSQKGTGEKIRQHFKDIDVVETGESMGKLCGLYITLCLAFRYALKHYEFDALLRMDTDALIIGPSPDKEALDLFHRNSTIGIAGQYPLDYQGHPWDISWPRAKLRRSLHTFRFFKRPLVHATLFPRYLRALRQGYVRGESVFGGACFFSYACLKALLAAGLLPARHLKELRLEEDHLFAILVKSLGFELASLSGEGLPMGCAWKGLPASPEKLMSDGKKIVHSTRYWEHMQEDEIRTIFRQHRKRITPEAEFISG